MRTRIAVACVPALLALAFALSPAGAGDPPAPAPARRAAVVNVLDYPSVKGDGVTDDSAAVQALIAAHPGRTIYFPTTAPDPMAGGFLHASYYFASALTVPTAAVGTTLRGDGQATLLKFGPLAPGIRLDGGNCTVRDLALHGSAQWNGANGSGWWEGVVPAGRYTPPGWGRPLGTPDGADGADGIQVANGGAQLANLEVRYFGRDGVNASAGDMGAFSSEVSQLNQVNVFNCRGHGVRVSGGDSNCTLILQGNYNVNQFWGISQEAFLAGAVISPQADGNGTDASAGDAAHPIAVLDRLVRSGNTVTGYWTAPYLNNFGTAPGLVPGDGLQVYKSPHDPSFLGRWRVATVAGDNLSFTYPQVAPDATTGGASTGHAATADGTLTVNSPIITDVDPTNLEVGMWVFGPGVPLPTNGTGVKVVAVLPGNRVMLNAPAAATGRRPLTFSNLVAAHNALPPDGTIASAVRASNVVTVTFSAPYTVGGNPFAVGGGISLLNTPLAASTSFNGTHVVTRVKPDNTQVEFAQLGPYESVASGTFRMAVPVDTWATAGLTGGAYHTANVTNLGVWVNPYAEGGQDVNYCPGTLLLNPVGATSGPGGGSVIHSEMANGNMGTSFPWGLATDQDGDLQYYEKVGVTFNGKIIGRHLDVLTKEVIWYTSRGDNAWVLGTGEPLNGSFLTRLGMRPKGETFLNGAPGSSVQIHTDPGTGSSLVVGDGTGGASRTTISGGRVTLAPTADADATVGCLYMGKDHRDADGNPRLCLKTPAGVKIFHCDDN